jgi:tRNA U34 5-methylaminomethyl-2-thiouridine-forming methyltransferase MnmC
VSYRIVRLSNGSHSVHSLAHQETFHPVVGPVWEAETLYVQQPKLLERLGEHRGDFVVWDVGLGAAANPITVLHTSREVPGSIRIVSFDHTLEPLAFALQNSEFLSYLEGFEAPLQELQRNRHVTFQNERQQVNWDVHVSDFPSFLSSHQAEQLPKPHLIMFDAFSPAKNPAMWTQPLFARLFRLLDPDRLCVLPTYSRSTMLRVTLLLAGFQVGVGHATGEKEQTTIAANKLEFLEEPLDYRWLERARRSTSAEPMYEPAYRQAPLAPESWERLRTHPQFRAESHCPGAR